jgi:tRNA A-37 threonylcarbamoyl transferase component Bud32
MRVTWNTGDKVQRVAGQGPRVGTWLAAVQASESLENLTLARTTDTAIVEVPLLGRVVRKRWRWPGMKERLRGVGRTTALARTPAEREYLALQRRYGPDAVTFHPRPLAVLVERRGALAQAAMLLLTEIPESVDLAEFLRDEAAPARRRAILADLATRMAAMHASGVTDGDCHPRNILIERAATRTWKVDCGRQRVGRPPATGRRAEYDLACLDVGLARFASRSERVRALATYLSARSQRGDLRSWATRVVALRGRIAPEESRRLPPPRDK